MLRLATVYAYNGHEDNHSFIGHLSVYKGGFADIETGLWNKNKWDYLYWWTAIQELSLILSTKIYDMFIIGLYHNLCNLISSCNLRKNRFLPVKKGRICSRQRRVLLSIYLWNMRQFEEKKYLHVQRKKYYYILTYNKNVYHVALMSLVCAKIEMMLLVSYLVSVVMLCVKENKYVCGFGFGIIIL